MNGDAILAGDADREPAGAGAEYRLTLGQPLNEPDLVSFAMVFTVYATGSYIGNDR
jgi:hypothetical protein